MCRVDKNCPILDNLERTKETAHIRMSPEVATKLLFILATSRKEVAWHGTVRKLQKGEYSWEDIVIYPQVVTGGSVRCDGEDEDGKIEYAKWQMNMCLTDPDLFDSIKLHGHSHVFMDVTPSYTDKDYQIDTIEQLQENSFYVFMIINKRLDCHAKIADREDNLLYTSVVFDTEDELLRKTAQEIEDNVQEEASSYGHK